MLTPLEGRDGEGARYVASAVEARVRRTVRDLERVEAGSRPPPGAAGGRSTTAALCPRCDRCSSRARSCSRASCSAPTWWSSG